MPWHNSRGLKNVTVVALITTDPRERLPSGIGVGSWRRQVRDVYPDCPREGSCDVSERGLAFSWLGFTTLFFKNGRVSEISIGLESSYYAGPRHAPDPHCRNS